MVQAPVTYNDTLDALRATLRQMAQWGCRGFHCPPESLKALGKWGQDGGRTLTAQERLERIGVQVGVCRSCGLADDRSQIVFGEGHPQADLLFVGAGSEADRSGRPFVGAAGQLLDNIIQAMNLTRDQVYICEIVKCRPSGNRRPELDQINACRQFLERQLAVIEPLVICTLGGPASRTLLNTTRSISRLRGRFHEYGKIRIMPTFDPADLLRNPDQKRAVWDDMQKIMALLRIPRRNKIK